MLLFSAEDCQLFAGPAAVDPESDAARGQTRDKLTWLHQQLYPEIRARRWDLHAHWLSQYLISTAHLAPSIPRIDFMLLRYGKPQTTIQMLKREFGEDFSHPYRTGLVGVRLDAEGLAAVLLLPERAWVDARNLQQKLASAPARQQLRHLFADLGGEYALSIQTPDHCARVHTRCTRLVNPGVLDDAMEKYQVGQHQLEVAVRYPVDHARLDRETIAGELIQRLGQLYLLYQFISWSPRNDHVSRSAGGNRQWDMP